MNRKRRSDPERIVGVISSWVHCVGMDENAEAAMVQHQPRYQRREMLFGEGDLKHRAVMRANAQIMPAAELHRKAFTDPRAQLFGRGSRRHRIVIDVSVIARNFRDWPWDRRSRCFAHWDGVAVVMDQTSVAQEEARRNYASGPAQERLRRIPFTKGLFRRKDTPLGRRFWNSISAVGTTLFRRAYSRGFGNEHRYSGAGTGAVR